MRSLYRSCCATSLTSPAAGRTAYVLTALLPQLQLMGLPFRCPGKRPFHGMAKHEVGARQQRLVQVGPHPFRSIPRRVVLEPAATQRADAHDLRPSLVKATGEVAEGGQEGGLVAVLAERGVLVPPGRLQDSPGNPALLDPLPAVVRPAARGWRANRPAPRWLAVATSPGKRRAGIPRSSALRKGRHRRIWTVAASRFRSIKMTRTAFLARPCALKKGANRPVPAGPKNARRPAQGESRSGSACIAG